MDMMLIYDEVIRNDDIKIWNKNLSEYLILIVQVPYYEASIIHGWSSNPASGRNR